MNWMGFGERAKDTLLPLVAEHSDDDGHREQSHGKKTLRSGTEAKGKDRAQRDRQIELPAKHRARNRKRAKATMQRRGTHGKLAGASAMGQMR